MAAGTVREPVGGDDARLLSGRWDDLVSDESDARSTSPSSTRMTRACIPMRTPSCEKPGLGRYPGVVLAAHVRATMAEPGEELMSVVLVLRFERGTRLT